MTKRTPPFSPEVGDPTVRVVLDHQGEHASQSAAIKSIAVKIDCSDEILRNHAGFVLDAVCGSTHPADGQSGRLIVSIPTGPLQAPDFVHRGLTTRRGIQHAANVPAADRPDIRAAVMAKTGFAARPTVVLPLPGQPKRKDSNQKTGKPR